MHQVADRGCVFRGTDGIVAHHAIETLHGPRSMEGENFVEVADVAMARIEAASRGATPILSALINVVWGVCVCVELA